MQQSTYMNAEPGAEFAALLDGHRRLIFKVAHTYARDAADVEDLAQEIAAQLWRAFPAYDRARLFSTWMYRIALNVAISWLRSEAPRRRRSVAYDADMHEPIAEEAADDDEGRRILRGFIASQDSARPRGPAALPRRDPLLRDVGSSRDPRHQSNYQDQPPEGQAAHLRGETPWNSMN